MLSDFLPSLRSRHSALEEARRALAASLRAEAAAEAAARDAERAINAGAEAARALTADDSVVEAFAAWLPGARRRADLARLAGVAAQAETFRARAGVALARAALAAATAQARRADGRDSAGAAEREAASDGVAWQPAHD